MVRIINEDLLRKCMEEEAHDEVSILGIENYSAMHGDAW